MDKFVDKPVIKIENLSKVYRLGEVGTGTLSHDLNRFWRMNILGQDDPYAKVGQVNDRTQKAQKGEHISALRDINLEVKQGEVLGIIGKNGAGKSTLLKLLSRVTSPTTGSIKVKGRLASLLEVGTGFHPEMTGRENIYMNGTIMGMRRWEIDRKLDEIVEFAGVAKYLDTPTKRYSSGMTVRLGFAIAAHLEPEILVVDEVLAVGDAEFQKKAIGKMQDVSTNDGRTVLFVSHNMASVRRLCQRGMLLNNGTVQETGEIEEIVDLYIKGNTETKSRIRTWPNNVDKSISITSAKVKTMTKEDNEIIDLKDEIEVLIEYTVNKPIKYANISLSLFKEGVLLFRTWDLDTDSTTHVDRQPGKYLAKLTLPDFLQTGSYSINIASGMPGIGIIEVKEDALNFEIENLSIDGKAQSFTRGGLIKTQIKWETQFIQ